MREPQQDSHCETFDQHLWANWPPADEPASETKKSRTQPDAEPRYVIAKSDSIEHLYWGGRPYAEGWGKLDDAVRYSRESIDDNKEPHDGFWMPLERAQELET